MDAFWTKSKANGFTLAEVLITLGIIGVVAAMTMPSLVAAYQKRVFITKIKYTYSIVGNAFTSAQADYGDPTTWDWGIGINQSNSARIIKTYISPYLNKLEEGVSKNLNYIILKNGVTLLFIPDGAWSGIADSPNDVSPSSLYILASLKNKTSDLAAADRDYSREDFVMQFHRSSKKLTFFNWGGFNRNGIINNSSYGCNLTIPKHRRLNCGGLIFYDNWEIKDDFPW